jgi:diguanylate cyclase (GGDEF)-like protein
MDAIPGKPASDQPDLAIVQRLATFEARALILVEVIAAASLLLWLAHASMGGVPAELLGMRLATAVAMLLLFQSLRRSGQQASTNGRRAAATLQCAVAVIALLSLGGHLMRGEVAAQAAPGLGDLIPWPSALALLFAALGALGARIVRMPLALLIDTAIVLLMGIVLMLLSGFLFGATGWFGDAGPPPTAPQTILCLMLIGFAVAARRTLYGFNAVLVGIGIGSRIARTVLPYAIALPFLLVLARTWIAEQGLLSEAYATGISVSVQALMFLGIVIWMALRINVLESELRHMSLADELTGINNRRGFMLLAEQALRVAHRERLPALLFFFDLDGLKRVNDTLGHDIGSDFLRKVADVLKSSFREGDVVARIGGDEFVVLAIDHDLPTEQTLRRASARAPTIREREQLPFEIAFSSGCAQVDINGQHALSKALQLADERMYEAKKARKAARVAAAA